MKKKKDRETEWEEGQAKRKEGTLALRERAPCQQQGRPAWLRCTAMDHRLSKAVAVACASRAG